MSKRASESEPRFWDCGYDNTTPTSYECLSCGEILVSDTPESSCQSCGSDLRNRSMPIE
ncbi:rubrerythrin-like domain-containing protein [Natronocalculus amylovorans]|uniref:Rubrerythrin-like domain-containing protein n=1 Tax=Natronocalculus amylovorans TaxID=2917812 RepID=A0AAE3FZQ1_9EURY|nr:rubrerythrin-like domain-containing protein [Natronocalculus amylovorans]MCL9818311.1 rubrerythrin-like domain-containing protein [Natronocalculus amylovorans]NUE04013.1 rubrerythrin-like domain-containing protein [Halorubraceae archaeon YAN]